jgi:hypothetical protein
MSPNAGGGVAGSQPMSTVQCVHGAQINFGEVTPSLTYEYITTYLFSLRDVAGTYGFPFNSYGQFRDQKSLDLYH